MAKNQQPPSIPPEEAIRKLQLSLLEKGCHEIQLGAAGCLLSRNDYLDVVTERSITNLCGYPLCINSLPADQPRPKSKYHISGKQVIDLQTAAMYCSPTCFQKSRTDSKRFFTEERPVWNSAKIDKLLKLFEELGLEADEILKSEGEVGLEADEILKSEGEVGLEEKKDELFMKYRLGLKQVKQMRSEDKVDPVSGEVAVKEDVAKQGGGGLEVKDLKIEEKVDLKDGFVSLEELIGPSNAVEGYVPKMDRGLQVVASKQEEQGSKTKKKSARPKKGKTKVMNEMDFTSEIIMGDPFSIPQVPSCPKLNSSATNIQELEGDRPNNPVASFAPMQKVSLSESGELSSLIMNSGLGIPKLLYGPDEDVFAKSAKESPSLEEMTESNETTLKSSVRSSGVKTLRRNVTWADERQTDNMSKGNLCEYQQVNDVSTESSFELKSERKSSRRSSGAKNLRRNVTWADERKNTNMNYGNPSGVQKVGDVSESADFPSKLHKEDDNGSERLASAEACVLALSQAAEAVASGASDEADAVSGAGIVILPQPYGDSQEEVEVEQELPSLEWSMKPADFHSYYFDPENSLYEAPPEGFSLTLSAFSTMWMALFEWITSSSLSYIYGRDECSHEDFSLVNGREYPCKIVSSDGRSSEIKQTLAVCLGRALPEVATELRLKTPISAMGKGLDQLLSTMTLVAAVPPFKQKQWHVIVFLFLDALSVSRIPGLASQMTTGTELLLQVLEGAHVSEEEYELMKDLIIPLGRVPQFPCVEWRLTETRTSEATLQ